MGVADERIEETYKNAYHVITLGIIIMGDAALTWWELGSERAAACMATTCCLALSWDWVQPMCGNGTRKLALR